MSNLQLPIMSYENLSTLSVGKSGKIGYATHIGQGDETVHVFHHGHGIAKITPFRVVFDNCGYHTRTTADRLHRIATANAVGSVRILKGEMIFTNNNGDSWVMDGSFSAYR